MRDMVWKHGMNGKLTQRLMQVLLLASLAAATATNARAAGPTQAYPGHLIEVGGQYLHLYCQGEVPLAIS